MADNDVLNLILSRIETIGKGQESLAKTQQETALLVERLAGRMNATEEEIKEIKNRPKTARDTWTTALQFGGCFGSIVFMFLSMISIGITVAVIIGQHWH
ncbi:MAG: hypothetical protein ACXWQR_20900 [Ktedonobacterales bacterium]